MKIKYVDGFEIRRTIMPNFHFSGKFGEYGCELIPKGEVWVEKEYRNESKQIIQYERLFQKLMKKMSYLEARAYINQHYLNKMNVVIGKRSYFNDNTAKIRNAAKDTKTWIHDIRKTIPIAFQLLEPKTISQIQVFFVRGEKLRCSVDVLFVAGGHHYVYNYIPKDEIWIDAKQNPREIKYTFFHELYEYQLMKKGMDYDSAHDFAIAFEKFLKRKDEVANYEFDAEENRNKILKKYPLAL